MYIPAISLIDLVNICIQTAVDAVTKSNANNAFVELSVRPSDDVVVVVIVVLLILALCDTLFFGLMEDETDAAEDGGGSLSRLTLTILVLIRFDPIFADFS